MIELLCGDLTCDIMRALVEELEAAEGDDAVNAVLKKEEGRKADEDGAAEADAAAAEAVRLPCPAGPALALALPCFALLSEDLQNFCNSYKPRAFERRLRN